MSEKSETTVIGSLPHSRPQRRSDKRGARQKQKPAPATKAPPERKRQAQAAASTEAQATPAPEPEQHANRPSSLPEGTELIGTVVKAAAELVEIGLTAGARALCSAVSKLPRP